MSLDIVSQAELINFIGYRQPKKQLQALRKLGIEPVVRPDNTLSVCREWLVNLNNKVKLEAPQPKLKLIK